MTHVPFMPRRQFLAALGLLGAGAALGCQRTSADAPPESPPLDPEVGTMVNAFAVDLYARLAGEKGNVFFSPFSISTALAMTAAGAQGDTATQMTKVLHATGEPAVDDKRYRGLMGSVSGAGKPYQLTTANAIWAQKGFPWRKEFKERVAMYGAGLRDADFAGQAEAERKAVNQWVEEQTKQKIKELFKPGTIDSLTRMVLANAIYFKGSWLAEFAKAATKKQPFLLSDGGKADCELMNRKATYDYAEDEHVQVCSLPYKGKDLSMVVVLPKKTDGLKAVESKLTADAMQTWVKALQSTSVMLSLPKFKVETNYKLNETLSTMGMRDAFDADKANFKGMHTSMDQLYITTVVHKAYCEVNEEGTEAAAATGVAVGVRSAPITKDPVFRADHPFLYAIRHNPSQSTLFLGRVEKP